MRLRSLIFATSALLGFASNALGAPTVSSHFNTMNDVEGWTTVRVNPFSLSLIANDGAPAWEAGHLKATEIDGGLSLLSAPTPFLGSKSAYFGGTLSYLLSDETADPSPTLGLFLVKSDLSVALGYLQSAPATTLTSYSVPLKADGNWYRYNGTLVPDIATDADIQSALSDLGFIGINADWTTRTNDVTRLDDVVLATPEPAPLAALALGVVAFAQRRTRRNA